MKMSYAEKTVDVALQIISQAAKDIKTYSYKNEKSFSGDFDNKQRRIHSTIQSGRSRMFHTKKSGK